ncbi:aminotransferase class I/II-fold pyridoxal phosphate-dependent enzyme [Muribaculaceae bacterium Isolate-002 (NCI)]|nr:aminotransferase class I/II-fold pyridoxal phosphate-dependent enzyme [Muribaculaceae bacterium Isolate-002 (NCI)]
MNPDNIRPASRVDAIEEYYFSRKLKEVAALNAAGADIISLGIGGPDRAPHAEVTETLAREAGDAGNHSYQPYTGIPALRKGYADWYKRYYGVELNPDSEILPLIGSKEGVLHVSLAFLNPGDGVLVPNPGYPTYSSVSKLVGARIVSYELDENNGWEPDFEALEKSDLSGVKLMWVNYPNMPTGARASKALYERLVDFGRRHGIVIVNDNPYSFILNDNPQSMLSIEGAKDVVIEMNSLSKSHNMAGWRLGMAASNATFISWVLKVKSNIDSGQFKPVMLAAVKALGLGDDWYAEVNAVYGDRRKVAEEIMDALGCSYDATQQGLFLWGKVSDAEASGEALADRVLDDARVFITPGFIFGSKGERYVRVSLCTPAERMREALARIIKMNDKTK